MTVKHLKQVLTQRGVSTHGLKHALVEWFELMLKRLEFEDFEDLEFDG